MRSKSTFVFFVVVFLVSCASPVPQPTATVVPSSTHTALPTSTEMLEPTPTAAPSSDEQGGGGDVEEFEEVRMTFEDWKKLMSRPFLGVGGEILFSDTSLFFTLEYENGLKAVYTDPDVVAKLPPQFPLLVVMPSGEMRFGTPPELAAGMVKEGATVLVTKSAIPIAQVASVLQAGRENGGQTWVTVDENPDFWAQVSYSFERDMAVFDPESGKWLSPGMPVPPKYFEFIYYDQAGNEITVSGLGYEFKDPEHWVDELIAAGYGGISIYTSPQVLR